jgi:hypothetical protein
MAHGLAGGEEEALIASHASFLMILSGTGGDEAMWRGFDRLTDVALRRRDVSLAAALVETANTLTVPAERRAQLAPLRSLAETRR